MAVMIINCPVCHKAVEAQIVAEYRRHFDMSTEYLRIWLLQHDECTDEGEELSLWAEEPDSDNPVMYWSLTQFYAPGGDGIGMPQPVVDALGQARKCYEAQAYDACAGMCRKAIEAICVVKKCCRGKLYDNLKELCERMIIDSKILDWSRDVQVLGDRGAHPYRPEVEAEEAKFALEFAGEVARYVFVLNEKYARFKSRGKKKESQPDKPDHEGPRD